MAINEKNLDQQYKDYLKKIELGEDLEEIELVDPEEYEDQGGIKSLDKAPSIKMASEDPSEEFDLELKSLFEEFLDKRKKGYKGSFSDYAKEYFAQKEADKEMSRETAADGGRMGFEDGTPLDVGKRDPKKYNFYKDLMEEEHIKYLDARAEQIDREDNPKDYPPSQRNKSIAELKAMLKEAEEAEKKKK